MVIGGIAANGEGIIETNQIGSCQPQQYLRKCNDFMQGSHHALSAQLVSTLTMRFWPSLANSTVDHVEMH